MYQHVFRFEISVNNAKFFIEIDNSIYEMVDDSGCLILRQKAFLSYIIKEVALGN
jgi:hypothetical protein